jgi:ABC-2 type transport system permease protein
MGAIYQKELKSYFNGMMGYVVLAFILLVGGFFCFINNFMYGSPYFESCLYSVSFVLLFVVPILTMRSVAEEKHSRTDQLLYALPLTSFQILFGKFLALCAVFAIPCGVMLTYPLLLSAFWL